MGGDYYDRDVVQTTSSTGYSDQTSKVVGVTSSLHLSMNPNRWKDTPLPCEAADPIVFALDVTGSMGDWSKIIYEKMPMFYGQIMMQNYLKEPSISFCAVGDATCDSAPLQVSEFGQGKEIDQLIGKMYLESGGGGNGHESYELSAYFYDHHVELTNCEMPFFFLTGDEGFWEELSKQTIQKIIGSDPESSKFSGKSIWKSLMNKYNVFFVKKPYDDKVKQQWIEALGEERILMIKTPKACIDIILGAIAITSGARTMQGYIQDMKDRQQSEERIKEVTEALKPYNDMLLQGKVKIVKGSSYKEGSALNQNNSNNQIKEITEKLILTNLTDQSQVDYFKALRTLHAKCPEKVPQDLICPLTGEILYEPFMTCDGHTFERKAIEEHLKSTDVSPITKQKLDSVNLIPNIVVKKLVLEFYNNNKNLI